MRRDSIRKLIPAKDQDCERQNYFEKNGFEFPSNPTQKDNRPTLNCNSCNGNIKRCWMFPHPSCSKKNKVLGQYLTFFIITLTVYFIIGGLIFFVKL